VRCIWASTRVLMDLTVRAGGLPSQAHPACLSTPCMCSSQEEESGSGASTSKEAEQELQTTPLERARQALASAPIDQELLVRNSHLPPNMPLPSARIRPVKLKLRAPSSFFCCCRKCRYPSWKRRWRSCRPAWPLLSRELRCWRALYRQPRTNCCV